MATSPEKSHSPLSEGRSKTATLQDVARVAGVTSMTVSRILKGKGKASPATQEMVQRIAKELNYSVNLSARALKTGRTGTIAVICGGLNQPYIANIVYHLDALMNASGYQMKLLHTQGALSDLINSTHASAVDGVIIAGMHNLVEQFREHGHEIHQPCVHLGIGKPEKDDYVHSNLRPAVEEALEAMVAAGRQRVAYVGVGVPGEVLSVADSEVRTQAYIAVMEKFGREPELISVASTYDSGGSQRIQTFKDYVQDHGCPNGLLCVNDDIAIHVFRALMDLGLKIPNDVLLAGCDGLPVLEYFEPPISTIAQPMEEICALAWQFLQNRMAEPGLPLQAASIDAKLLERRSLRA